MNVFCNISVSVGACFVRSSVFLPTDLKQVPCETKAGSAPFVLRYLKPNDEIVTEVEGIGRLVNTVA